MKSGDAEVGFVVKDTARHQPREAERAQVVFLVKPLPPQPKEG